MRTLVVISHYDARGEEDLAELARTMQLFDAGHPYDVQVVVNQTAPRTDSLARILPQAAIAYRENTGYNIGAWQHGWATQPGYDAYLFLQDECRVLRSGWLRAFVDRARNPQVGLLGESLNPAFNRPWPVLERVLPRGEHLLDGRESSERPAHRIAWYRYFLDEWNIPAGDTGRHLQSLVLFSRREVLEAISGFHIGADKLEAIASEIAISRAVESLGLSVEQIGWQRFRWILHPQWKTLPMLRRVLNRLSPRFEWLGTRTTPR